jgi:response regulator RpfG family c-di-GMP phosphodiesterase
MTELPVKCRVLLVDDEPGVCSLLNQTLSPEGFACHNAHGGEEAAVLLKQETFDVVISDLRMPGVSGLDLLAYARKIHPHMAFIMVTAEDDLSVAIQAMKEGADDYLVKPFQPPMVVSSVNRALEKRRLERELENYRQRLEELVKQRTQQLEMAMKRIELTYDETLEALGAALDLRDNETAGHAWRVTRYCLEIAKLLGCPGEQLKHIARGAYLHDIGKIGVPDAILLKPDKLTVEETEVMQAHARIGYDLVSRIAFLAPAAEIVLAHQERFDGTGYPQGLRGSEIPLGARIFALADTLDAMMSDRPYRRALPFSVAKAEIIRESGRQFDPDVVQAFLSMSEEVWENIRMMAPGPDTRLRPGLSAVVQQELAAGSLARI